MAYLQISTRVTITAPIVVWEDLLERIRDTLPRKGPYNDIDDSAPGWALYCILNRDIIDTLERLRKQQGRIHSASWDYDYPLIIDNLTPDEEALIRAAWEARA